MTTTFELSNNLTEKSPHLKESSNIHEVLRMMRFEYKQLKERFDKQETNKLQSDDLSELFGALALAQLEMCPASKDGKNEYFKNKYSTLTSVVETSRPFLSKNGLCVIQRPVVGINNEQLLLGRLGHSSGQWIESTMLLKPPKDEIQNLGMHISYVRRYQYCALTGVVSEEDKDDDGNASTRASKNNNKLKNDEREKNKKISREQLEIISLELREDPEIADRLLKAYNIQKISDVLSTSYDSCLSRIKSIKLKNKEKEV